MCAFLQNIWRAIIKELGFKARQWGREQRVYQICLYHSFVYEEEAILKSQNTIVFSYTITLMYITLFECKTLLGTSSLINYNVYK